MANVQKVFDIAIHMMDEQSQDTGATMTEDTEEYKFRTISILNVVLPSLYPYSRNYFPDTPCPLLAQPADHSLARYFKQEIPLEDSLAVGVLPYALAAHLLAGENEELSAWFLARYHNAFSEIRNRNPAVFEPIQTPYGLF